MPTVDGSSIKEFPTLPAATYEAAFSEWKNDDKGENVTLIFIVTEGEFLNQKLFTNRNLQPQSLWSFKKTTVALGADPELFVGEFDTDEILQGVQGAACRLKVSIRGADAGAYAGRNNVDDVIAPAYAMP